MTPPRESDTLRSALVAAFRPYVLGVLAARGQTVPEMEITLDEGSRWLDSSLADLFSLPFGEQPRGPLEVFQEAMRFPTEVLQAAGITMPQRDATAMAALPGDVYDLAPASSQVLGEDVWTAHMAWGAAKARAFRPSVGLLSRDLMDRSKIEPSVGEAGFRLVVWRGAEQLALDVDRPAMAFVDLSHPQADEVIGALAAESIRVIGFGPHVDDHAMVRARTLGAADALPRSVFFRTIGRLLPTVV